MAVGTMPLPVHAGLRRSDWLLLSLVGLSTAIAVLGLSEFIARRLWPAQEADSCYTNGAFRPNCTSHVKIPEGVWATDHYNDCGYRDPTSCKSKPAGVPRVVILGSSSAHGLYLPYNETFAAQMACRMHVNVQNLGVANTTPLQWAERMKEALALQPDAVLVVITPFDVQQLETAPPTTATAADNLSARLHGFLSESRAAYMAEHFLFEDRARFLHFYLLYGDRADLLRVPLAQAWRTRFNRLDGIFADIGNRLRAAHVPWYVLALPSRAETALLREPERPAGTDPFTFTRNIQQMTTRHGGTYIDVMTPFGKLPHPESLYYVVAGHVKPEGQTIIARQIASTMRVAAH